MKTHIDIIVRYSCDTYVTSTVGKTRASSTVGPELAARRLGEKLYGAALRKVEQRPGNFLHIVTMWRIHASGPMLAKGASA